MIPRPEDLLSRAVAQTILRLGPKPVEQAACDAMDEVFSLAESTWTNQRRAPAYMLSAPPVACKAGCGWCCHQQVGVTPLEAVRLAAHIRALPETPRAAITARIAELDRRTRGLTTTARLRTRLACAFLGADGGCMIYPVRPLRCRGAYSTDADFCIACHDDLDAMQAKMAAGELKPVFLDTPQRLFDAALGGVLAGMRGLRMVVASLELTAAINALLADPRLARRWLAGAKPAAALHLVPDQRQN